MFAEGPISLPEEETTTPRNLFKISFFAVFAFLAMASMLDAEARKVPFFVGGLILFLLVATAGWLEFQSRYGSATLTATSGLIPNRTFQGVIHTELMEVPSHPVRIILFGWYRGVEVRVAPEQMQRNVSGTVRIPFSFVTPPAEGYITQPVRLYVRTRYWPIGWGATFLFETPRRG